MNSLFLDANILLDILLPARHNHENALSAYAHACEHFDSIGTSENILTTVEYIAAKNGTDCTEIVRFFEQLHHYFGIHNFTPVREPAIALYKKQCQDGKKSDFEDLLQILCAQHHGYTSFWTEDRKLQALDCQLTIVDTTQLLEM